MSRSLYAVVEVGLVLILAACAGLAMTARPAAPGDTVSQPGPTAPLPNPSMIPTNAPSTSLVKPGLALSPPNFFARPDGSKGIAVAYESTGGGRLFTLPSGMMSGDGRSYVTARLVVDGTQISRFDLATGEESPRLLLEDRWELSGLSASGRWLALTRLVDDAEKVAWTKAGEWHTEIQIVDAEKNATARLLKLDGNFEAETISIDGQSLFLIEHLPAINPDHYVIRLYDLSQKQLITEPLRLKGSDEVMAGYAWEGLPSKDGRWLFTLYLNTQHQEAFVHGLNMIDKYTVCIDLPSGEGDFEQLKYYTQSLSPDGRTLYAANAALGLVAEVDLSSLQTSRVESFAPQAVTVDPQSQTARSLMSANGKALYFTSGNGVWVYDATKGEVTGPLVTGGPIAGMGLSPDSARLFVAGEAYLLGIFEVTADMASR